MSLLYFKIGAAVLIITLSLITGLLPVYAKATEHNKRFFILGEAFASGVFLGAAFLHMLPQSVTEFTASLPGFAYPLATLICLLGFLLLVFIEKIYFRTEDLTQSIQRDIMTPYILAVVLSIHALIGGAALGIETTMSTAIIIFIAIIAHKGSASFALGIQLKTARIELTRATIMIVIFSCMTPLGIACGTLIAQFLKHTTGEIVEAVFTAFAAGTFLYIGTIHTFKNILSPVKSQRFTIFLVLALGVLIMALLAIWV